MMTCLLKNYDEQALFRGFHVSILKTSLVTIHTGRGEAA